jgi:predicted HTH domain antitoxin
MSSPDRFPPSLGSCDQLPLAMQPLRSVASEELSPKARELLGAVQRGETIFFEAEGEARSQERFNQVLAHYLAEAISLSRASELLEMTPNTLRVRFDRLEVPRRIAPSGQEETNRDVQTALNWPDVAS